MSIYILPIILLGYLVGSIPFSFLTAKYLGKIDIRNYGSGNSGATNVLRTLGKKAGTVAFIGDFLKGFILVTIVKSVLGLDLAIICSISAVFGHCYPIYLKFKGGKGVATSGGTIFALYPLVGVILAICLFTIVKVSKMVSLGSISAAFLLPIISLLLNTEKSFLIYSIIAGLFVIYKHKANISRLIQGKESKLGSKPIKKNP
ncbi:glycerol-3-phosphate 1-O-acyltransferase PlsY [Oceanirhabdus sp. W0125-5]|uniref:glycerol-3-phosphate 1-O-acyltransferase PlsY n=1 Tax=Oceanirhabdus sp. W0125-5 TaxID=2999116 RepID=UPI0022F32ECC|nr:glycerol-3-phosphate 1-O-acyltransferase PlsY [Oceanirhabdus sp. W0125-5]WBW94704.1 glycerol-3-phosphate 1-O-acyltransferase PlsY [Oceanirhabdus sp. W0125-5]